MSLLTGLAGVIFLRTRSTFGFSHPGRFLAEATDAVSLLGWATQKDRTGKASGQSLYP